MFDHILTAVKRSQLGALEHGRVNQSGSAQSLFSGNFDGVMSVEAEFGGTRLGIGVMDNLEGEVVSLKGQTWAVPSDGRPREVSGSETIAFGIAAHGGLRHSFHIPEDSEIEEVLAALDSTLSRHHIDHEHVVCALEIEGTFRDTVLMTVHRPDYAGESLGEIIDDEIRFSFPRWEGTVVGFRYPDTTTGLTIPGLHLHGISSDRTSGGHVRNLVTDTVTAHLWLDELVLPDEATEDAESSSIDFNRYEGPVED